MNWDPFWQWAGSTVAATTIVALFNWLLNRRAKAAEAKVSEAEAKVTEANATNIELGGRVDVELKLVQGWENLVEDLRGERAQLVREITSLRTAYNDTLGEMKTMRSEIASLREDRSTLVQRLQESERRNAELEQEVARLREELHEWKSRHSGSGGG